MSKMFVCEICEQPFTDRAECIAHKKEHISGAQRAQAAQAQSSTSSAMAPSPAEQPPIFMPEDTKPVIPDSKVMSTAEAKKELLSKVSDEDILAKLVERQAAYVCMCGIVFKDQTLYYLHRGSHSSNNPKQCSFCGFTARDWYDFMTHFFTHKASA